MKLSPALRVQQLALVTSQPFEDVLDDACELLTMQILLWIKKRVKADLARLETITPNTDERTRLASEINGINRLYVALAEAV